MEGESSAAPPVAAGEELAAGKRDGEDVLRLLDAVLITSYSFNIIFGDFSSPRLALKPGLDFFLLRR